MTGDNDRPKSFVEALSEELGEIELLRQKRDWHEPITGRQRAQGKPPAAGSRVEVPPEGVEPEPEDHADPDTIIKKAHASHLVGIAFSGGGIRSATFNLGVLQALADLQLLNRFDYISTVSGGGYIGAWLAAWIKRAGLPATIRGLQTDRTPNPNHSECEQIRFLREFSNYLTPRLGFFSLDTWSMVATYLRNTLLNLAILVIALAGFLLSPHAGVAVDTLVRPYDQWPFLWGGIILFMIVHFIAVNTSSKIFSPPGGRPFACFTHPSYVRVVGLAVLPAAWFLALWLSKFRSPPAGSGWLDWAARGALTYSLLWLLAHIVALVAEQLPFLLRSVFDRVLTRRPELLARVAGRMGGPFPKRVPRVSQLYKTILRERETLAIYLCHALTIVAALLLLGFAWKLVLPHQQWLSEHISTFWLIIGTLVLSVAFIVVVGLSRRRTLPNRPLEFFAILFAAPYAGALAGVLLGRLISVFNALADRKWGPFHFFVLATPLVIAVLLFVATLHVGLMGLMLRNQKREWWSRLGGWVLLLTIFWLVICGMSLYVWPFPHAYSNALIGRLVKWGFTPAWILATVGGVLGGKSKTTGDNQKPRLERVISIAPYIFVVGLLAGLSYLLSSTLVALDGAAWGPPGLKALIDVGARSTIANGEVSWFLSPAVWFTLTAAALLVISLFLAWRVDINDFSMHLFYRNRLVRCYLGASHGTARKPQPFIGFDPDDDMLMKDLRANRSYTGPFPIINAALNLVKGKELAWQERKAESFVFTPLHCGFDAWLEKLLAPHRYAYRPTESYGYADGGPYLGTAMSISGAAASPNMGYHSNPALAFLMTVFNVRLGWWAGNPRRGTWQRPSPLIGLGCLFSELTGNTDDDSRYVYLSDGGHFDNLGIYELVKRRCKYIITCDAGADGNYAFGDLGNAIRKCREDIGVEIKIDTDRIVAGPSKHSLWHYAVGEIHYENVDPAACGDHPGILLYLKASLTGDEPADVLNYKTDHSDFPHETTVDQWFTESQFESYRRLGQHIACTVFEKLWNKAGLAATLEQRRTALRQVPTEMVFQTLHEASPGHAGNC